MLFKKPLTPHGETDEPTIIVGDFSTFLSVTDRSSRENTSKDIAYLNSTTNQPDLVNIYEILNPTTTEYMFFSR